MTLGAVLEAEEGVDPIPGRRENVGRIKHAALQHLHHRGVAALMRKRMKFCKVLEDLVNYLVELVR